MQFISHYTYFTLHYTTLHYTTIVRVYLLVVSRDLVVLRTVTMELSWNGSIKRISRSNQITMNDRSCDTWQADTQSKYYTARYCDHDDDDDDSKSDTDYGIDSDNVMS
jgi:hypothetical protein